ncbi:MAG: hydantoinase/oxoprolinase family protein, partial [Candidatus Kariarchaeaceae archaeon]
MVNSVSDRNRWLIAAIDVGGTFTDTIAISSDEVFVFKIPSTPHNPLNAVISSVQRLKYVDEVIHGTTVATNAVLERKGAKVALVTTKGFADVIEIGRQNREDIYSLYPTRPEPLVPGSLRFEVDERIISDGSIEKDLTEGDLSKIREEIKEIHPESIAVCTLFSFLNPIHERKINEILKGIAPISLSSEVLPEYREYERTSTTVMDAYVKPLMSTYLNELDNQLIKNNFTRMFAVMKSSRGLARGRTIAKFPVDTLFSGLAGGVQAGELTSKILSVANIISLDIGGTSTDVASIIDGKGSIMQTQKISGLPVSAPAVDVETIGAGGGSLIQLISGLLRVGPESAGANPGPMAYDNDGKIPTVTDADLCYGILPLELAGGELLLNKDLSIQGLHSLSKDLVISFEDTIKGVRRVFHENIGSALRSVSTERGLDPRTFSLLAFGGAGPVHAVELAELMGMTNVIIPPFPGVWSAMGLIGGDFVYNSSIGRIIGWDIISELQLEDLYLQLIVDVNKLADEDEQTGERIIQRECSLRFKGQSFDLNIPYQSDKENVKLAFLELHKNRYGFAAEHEPLELVALRVSLIIPHDDPILPELEEKKSLEPKSFRKILGYNEEIPVFEKKLLGRNFEISGPVIIDQDDTTTWIPKDWTAKINKFGFIIV